MSVITSEIDKVFAETGRTEDPAAQVVSLLKALNLSQHAPLILEQEVDLDVLEHTPPEDLFRLGLKYGPIFKIKNWFRDRTSKMSHVDSPARGVSLTLQPPPPSVVTVVPPTAPHYISEDSLESSLAAATVTPMTSAHSIPDWSPSDDLAKFSDFAPTSPRDDSSNAELPDHSTLFDFAPWHDPDMARSVITTPGHSTATFSTPQSSNGGHTTAAAGPKGNPRAVLTSSLQEGGTPRAVPTSSLQEGGGCGHPLAAASANPFLSANSPPGNPRAVPTSSLQEGGGGGHPLAATPANPNLSINSPPGNPSGRPPDLRPFDSFLNPSPQTPQPSCSTAVPAAVGAGKSNVKDTAAPSMFSQQQTPFRKSSPNVADAQLFSSEFSFPSSRGQAQPIAPPLSLFEGQSSSLMDPSSPPSSTPRPSGGTLVPVVDGAGKSTVTDTAAPPFIFQQQAPFRKSGPSTPGAMLPPEVSHPERSPAHLLSCPPLPPRQERSATPPSSSPPSPSPPPTLHLHVP